MRGWWTVGDPRALYGLLACVLLVLLARVRSRASLSPRAARWALVARVLAVACVVLAASDLRVMWPTRDLAVAVALDASASVSDIERSAVARGVQATVTAQPTVVFHTVDWGDGSDLGRAIQAAVATLPSDRARRILLATDGRETVGNAVAAARAARRVGARVYVLPVGDRPLADGFVVRGIELPRLVRASQPFTARVRLQSRGAQRVAIELRRDGVLIDARTVEASDGGSEQEVPLTIAEEGVHGLSLVARPAGPSLPTNDVWHARVRVISAPRVLLVHQNPTEPPLATVFRDGRLRVDTVGASGVPSEASGLEPYQLVALDELDLMTLSEPQRAAIRQWVTERGGGLITVTGGHPMMREPDTLRAIEPVEPPHAIPDPRPLELVLVIDRSGSMGGYKMEQARRAAIAAVMALREDARVGVVAFSDGADAVQPLVPMERRGEAVSFISRIHPGGGTDIAAALRAARGLVTSDPRYIHHVILLSDGESDAPPALAASNALAAAGATVSAITIGPYSGLMANIARTGHGRYHVSSGADLTPLFVREAQFRQPPPHREGAFVPTVEHPMAFLDGVDFTASPPITGYALSDLRHGAQTVLSAPDGSPFLAHWFVGTGQVLTLTSATSGRWADGWRTAPSFRRMWTQAAWEMLRQRGEDPLDVHVEPSPAGAPTRTVTVVSPDPMESEAPQVRIARTDRDAKPLSVRRRGPGVWQTEVPVGDGFVVDARRGEASDPTAAAASDRPYDPELAAFGADRSVLAAIAEAGGGRVLARPQEITEAVETERVPRRARTTLLALAVLAYLAGVLMTRLVLAPSRTVPPRAVAPDA